MAQLPGRRAQHLRRGARAAALALLLTRVSAPALALLLPRVSAAALALLLPRVAPAESLDLVGTWHVLVHYQDANTANPDAWRWDDRIWEFEPAGSRLRWTEYPIVVFRSSQGRFEALGTNRARRVVHAWEPDAGQQRNLEEGLEVNPRGAKSKTLRGSDAKGWRSAARAAPASATTVTYTENWSIANVDGLPVFERVDVLGSMRTESLDGVTRYTATAIEEGGRRVEGRFERDGTRVGRFVMRVTPPVKGVEGSGKSQSERVHELFFGDYGKALLAGEGGVEAETLRRAREGELSDEEREEIRRELRRAVERSARRYGMDPKRNRRQIESLTDQVERLVFEEGRSPEEVGRMLERGEIRP